MSIFRVCVMVACSLRRAPKKYPSEGNFFRVFPWRTEKAGFRFAPSQVFCCMAVVGFGVVAAVGCSTGCMFDFCDSSSKPTKPEGSALGSPLWAASSVSG